MKVSKRVIGPFVVIILVVSIVFMLIAGKGEVEVKNEVIRPVSLGADRAFLTDVSFDVITQGEVASGTEINLVSQVRGRIVKVAPRFVDGGSFKKDQIMLEIDDFDYLTALSNAKADVAGRQTLLAQAEADGKVARQQLAGLDASNLGLRKPQIAQAKASLEAAQANLKQAYKNLERTKVSVSFDGRIRQIQADVGQFVTVGAPLASVFSIDVAKIRLALTDAQLASIGVPIGYLVSGHEGPVVNLTATVAGEKHQWKGHLNRVEAAIDPGTRLLYAVVEVENPYQVTPENSMPLAVGLYVTASVKGKDFDNAIAIPRAALRPGNVVYAIYDGLMDVKSVEVLYSNDELAVIGSGIEEGDIVVTAPVTDPLDGMRVRPLIAGEELEIVDPEVFKDGSTTDDNSEDKAKDTTEPGRNE